MSIILGSLQYMLLVFSWQSSINFTQPPLLLPYCSGQNCFFFLGGGGVFRRNGE
uniref:Uncharacterized protein n=1 Tax=Zea mays TaxID=4577 RepID=C0HH89_MAIZE|nr:unknown [Zea mays]